MKILKQVKILVLISFLFQCSNVLGQSAKENTIKQQIITLEQAGWKAWQHNDASWFKENTSEKFLSINSDGISTKEQVIAATASECEVLNVSLDDFNFVMLSDDVVILTYVVSQQGECDEIGLTPKVRVAVNYVKQGKKWMEALYMETPANK